MMADLLYVGKTRTYDIFFDGKCVQAQRNKKVTLPIWKCKELIQEQDEFFMLTPETAKELKKYLPERIVSLKDKHKGKRIFIVGSGASLKGFDFNRLDNELTIILNHTIRFYNKGKYLMFLDKKFIKECNAEIMGFKGEILTAYRTDFKDKNSYRFHLNRNMPTLEIEDGLYNGKLSGLTALNLALIMGATEIYLLGFDLKPEEPYYFFEGKKSHYSIGKCERTIEFFRTFEKYKDRIFNCNKDSGITFFNYADINEVLK